jgi:hypothetical protein
MPAFFHEMGAETKRRFSSSQPVFMRFKLWPRSWRRPPQQPISQVEEPKCLRKWGFWDSPCHSEWPKVADAVIKAQIVIH